MHPMRLDGLSPPPYHRKMNTPAESLSPVPRSTTAVLRLGLVSFVVGFSGAMMPGTLLVAVIEQTAVQGLRAVVGLLAGHALLELILLGLLVAGFETVLARRRVRGMIGLVGGAALLFMGWDMLSHAMALHLDLNRTAETGWSWPELIFWGAAICLANPYFTGWWATIGAGQIANLRPRTTGEYLAFYVGHEGADFVWYLGIGLLIVTGKRWITDGMYQGLILVCGLVVLAMGLWFLRSGWRFLRGRIPGEVESEPTAGAAAS